MSKNKISERLFFLKFPNAILIEANGKQFYFNPTDEAKTIYERVGDSYYKYKLSFDDELLPIIQNAINNAELHQAKLKQKDKSYSYER